MPLWVEELGPAARRIAGVLQFHLAAGAETRSWYVDFGPSPPVVLEAQHPAPTLTLTLDEAEVVPLLTGTLELEAALARGTIAVEGEVSVLERWLEVMSGQLSGMRTRYAAVRAGSEADGG